MSTSTPSRKLDSDKVAFLRGLAIELIIYTPLVTVYFIIVLRHAWQPLLQLYRQHALGYALVSLLLIIGQGAFLEVLTSWLVKRFGLRS